MAPMPPDEYPNRIKRARALMRERGMDGLIVTDTMHYSYYTGHKVASWMRSRPSIFVLPLEGAPALITWSGPDMFARLYQAAVSVVGRGSPHLSGGAVHQGAARRLGHRGHSRKSEVWLPERSASSSAAKPGSALPWSISNC